MKVLINGLSAKSAGGRSVFVNLVRSLVKQNTENHYYLLVGKETMDVLNISIGERIHWVEIHPLHSLPYFMPYSYIWYLPKLIQKIDIDVILNLADVPVKTPKPQVLLFDWPYAVYPDSIVWNTMPLADKLYRKSKLRFFKKYLRYIDLILAQSDIMKERLESLYEIKKVSITPNALSLDNLDGGIQKDFHLPSGQKFLYLTRYYPHKNLHILLDIAEEIKKLNKDWKLIITIDRDQDKSAAEFIDTIVARGLSDIILNVGSVEMKYVPSLYQQSDYLLMPTLLESFSGTYVEAMYHKIPILTSDMDFAKAVCKDAAVYFDPTDSNSIYNAMQNMIENKLAKEYIQKGTENLQAMASWTDTASIVIKAIDEVANVSN